MSTINHVYEFLKGKVFYPATTDADGKPHVRPFGAVALVDGRLFICTNSEKAVSRQLKRGDVEIAATADNGDWIRITARAVLDNSPKAKEQLYNENPRLKEIYTGREQLFETFYLVEGTASLFNPAGETLWNLRFK